MPSQQNDELKQTFIAFREECIWLQTCFNTFQALFAGGDRTDFILKRSAPLFFNDLNTILVEYWVLLIGRITDPERMGSNENLSVKYLVDALGRLGLLTAEMQSVADELQGYRNLVNDARNKLVSHADRAAFLKAAVLGQHTEASLTKFVSNLQRFNDLVGEAVGEGPLDYQATSCSGDVYDLLRALNNTWPNPSYMDSPRSQEN